MADDRPTPGDRSTRPTSSGGREEFAATLRRLNMLSVTAVATPGEFAAAAAALGEVADRLEVPGDGTDGTPQARFRELAPDGEAPPSLAAAMPFDMIVGPCNPVAPPIEIWFDPPLARAKATFTPTYEGAPGCVHGAAIAASFDMVLTAANVLADRAGPTVELTIRYRRPTRIGVVSDFEASVTEVTERRTHSEGRLLQDGLVVVEAFGEFVNNMDRDRIHALHRRHLEK